MITGNKNLTQAISFLLIILWIYAASSKLMDFGLFERQMEKQMLLPILKKILVYAVPASELIISFLLLFSKTQRLGFYLSLFLLAVFTSYIALVVVGIFGKVPCSCGGILRSMGWNTHLIFNLFFLLLIVLGICTIKRERRAGESA